MISNRGFSIRLRPALDRTTCSDTTEQGILTLPHGTRLLGAFSFGRDALWNLAVQELHDLRDVWLPEYCCPDVAGAFRRARWVLHTYPLKNDFSVDWDGLHNVLPTRRNKALFLLIDFLGFPQDVSSEHAETLSSCFHAVIRDMAQGLPHDELEVLCGSERGFFLFSLRKPLPIPDFALLCTTGNGQAAVGRFYFEQGESGSRTFSRWLFVQLEFQLLRHQCLMSLPCVPATRQILKRSRRLGQNPSPVSTKLLPELDIQKVRSMRQRNAKHLLLSLRQIALYKRVSHVASPYYFPIVVESPLEAQAVLAKLGIQTTTLWGTKGFVGDKSSNRIRTAVSQLLCLPVHQGLTATDLDFICRSAADVLL